MTEATDEKPGITPLSHNEIMIVISGLMMAMLLAALDQTIVSTALTKIVSELNGSTHLSWVVTAYLITSTASAPLYGKIGDLYGRKRIFLAAICIFLIGSGLCGAAANLPQLIAFRALQGIGAGGLFSLAIAIIGDIVSPRERGRYQGYFGAVFGLSSVVGPLLGGWLTESLSWRWVFYVNLPLGVIALAMVSTSLKLPTRRTEHRIDYLGAALLTAGVCAVLLALVWGGGHPANATHGFSGYPWASVEIIGLLVGGLALFGIFTLQESRHAEPILPLELFKDKIFTTGVLLSFVAGAAMFGAVVYIPQYQQIVKGFSPTESGLLMIPMTIGVVAGAVSSGRIISKRGRYKFFPVAGTLILSIGFAFLSTLDATTNQALLSVFMVVIGVGIGFFMQTVTLAVQNSVDFKHLGAATSATIFFRTLGGCFGTAALGSILNTKLRSGTVHNLGADKAATVDLDRLEHGLLINSYGTEVAHKVFAAYANAVHWVFVACIPLAVVGFILSVILPEQHLRETARAQAPSE